MAGHVFTPDLKEKAVATHEGMKHKAEEARESAMATAKKIEENIKHGVEDLKARAAEAHESVKHRAEAAREEIKVKIDQASHKECDKPADTPAPDGPSDAAEKPDVPAPEISEPAKDSAKDPPGDPVTEPVEEGAEKPVEEGAKEPVEESAKEPVKEPVKEPSAADPEARPDAPAAGATEPGDEAAPPSSGEPEVADKEKVDDTKGEA